MQCPVCEERWPDDAAHCVCGFDFTTRDPNVAIARLSRAARNGNNVWRRGLVGMLLLPITFFVVNSLPAAMVLAMAQLGLSVVWIIQGLVRADVANRKLAAAKQLITLPAARLLR